MAGLRTGRDFRLFLACTAALSLLGIARPAQAKLSVCNQTFDVVNLAIGLHRQGSLETEGWWTIGPKQCATVIDGALPARFIYAFALNVFGQVILEGAIPMCVAPDRFRIHGEADCLIRGYLEARFQEFDTLDSKSWRLFLYPPPG